MRRLLLALLFATASCFCSPDRETLDLRFKFHQEMYPAQMSEDALIWFTGVPEALLNSVFYLADTSAKVDDILAKAPIGVPLAFWIPSFTKIEGWEDILQERGFKWVMNCPAMRWKTAPVPLPDLEVRPTDTQGFVNTFFWKGRFSDEAREGYSRFLEKSSAERYLVYIDGKPVGTASLFIDGNMGHVCNVATLPEYQRRGAGRAIMLFIMNRAHLLGLKQLSLQSSPAAIHLYESLGFEKKFDLNIYIR